MPEPRCLTCGYVLTGLRRSTCPECNRPFELGDPATYTTTPPIARLNRWRFWFPGFLLAFGAGAVLYPLLIYYTGFRSTVSLLLPLCLGTLIGYGCRVSFFLQILLAIIVLIGLVFCLYTQSVVGIFCGLVLGAVALGPLILGTLLGAFLRILLKQGSWDQRWHLPTLILFLAAPLAAGTIESHYQSLYPDEYVRSTVSMPVSADHAWNAVMFYEEIHERPPFLMRFALPRPLFTRGSTDEVGDMKVCVYSKGRLVKRVSQRVPNVILAFDLVEQTKIENRSVVLKGGSFQFVPIDANQTYVTLMTRYQPLLGPRWAWRWAEKLGIHTMHDYVLNGMRLKALSDAEKLPPLPRPPLQVASKQTPLPGRGGS